MNQIVFLGGDARMQAAAEAFVKDGCQVCCLWAKDTPCPSGMMLQEALHGTNTLVLPVPALDDHECLRTNGVAGTLSWADIQACLPDGCLVCGGGLQSLTWEPKYDMLQDEAFALANAVPAALALVRKT